MNFAVEHIARAFHAVQDDSVAWENEPDILKEEFRNYAREALALFAEYEAMQLTSLDGTEGAVPDAIKAAA